MKFFSFLKRKRHTRSPGFRDYNHRNRRLRRKPIKAKKSVSLPLDRLGKKTAIKKVRVLWVLKGILALGVLAGIIYVLFFTTTFEIQKIQIKGSTETLDEEAALNEYLQIYLGKNILLFPTGKHEKNLLYEFPYLKTLKINRKLPHSLNVILEAHSQIANIQIEKEDGTKDYYIVNDLGYIAAIGASDETLPNIVMDVTGTDIEFALNVEVIPPEILATLVEVGKDFEAKFKMNILATYYLKRAKEVHLYTERDFMVWIDLTQPVDEQLAKLKKALTKLNIYESSLTYIDLRISGQNGEKVIYKLSN